MGDPRRSIGLTTACRVGTVRSSVFLSQLTKIVGAVEGAVEDALCAGSAPLASTAKIIRVRAARWFGILLCICLKATIFDLLKIRNRRSLLRQRFPSDSVTVP